MAQVYLAWKASHSGCAGQFELLLHSNDIERICTVFPVPLVERCGQSIGSCMQKKPITGQPAVNFSTYRLQESLTYPELSASQVCIPHRLPGLGIPWTWTTLFRFFLLIDSTNCLAMDKISLLHLLSHDIGRSCWIRKCSGSLRLEGLGTE